MSPPSPARRWVRRAALALGGGFGLLVAGLGVTVAYAYTTADSRLTSPSTPVPPLRAATDLASIERGRYLVYGPAHCSQCHGETYREHPEANAEGVPLAGGLAFPMGPMGTAWAANLTPDPETGIATRTDGELARAIRTGVLHDGRISLLMRYSAANLADEDLAAVIGYLRSTAAVPNAVPAADRGALPLVALFFTLTPDATAVPRYVEAGAEPSAERGEYLADSVMLCTTCHRPYDLETYEPIGSKGMGGIPEQSHGLDTDMEFVAPNLTADPATGVTGRLDEDAFVARMRHGRVHASSIMPWENFGRTAETDLRSVYRYLHALPPVVNDVGPSYRKLGWAPGDPVR